MRTPHEHRSRFLPIAAAGPAAAVAAALALAGCGNDIIAVHGRIADPAPEVGSFHEVLGTHALDIASLDTIPTDPNGDFSWTYSDGTVFHGNVNKQTGDFDVTIEYPFSFTLSIHDVGRLALFNGRTSTANYAETFAYVDGTESDWDDHLVIVDASTVELDAYEHGRDVYVASTTTLTQFTADFFETWDRPNTFHEEVRTNYGTDAVHQNWFRDDFATDAKPDRSATFTFNADGSGSGQLNFFYDHGIYYSYDIAQANDGSYAESVVFEDPGTSISPDGSGSFQFAPNYSGSGTYTESYTDGSRLDLSETFAVNFSEHDVFTFDDAATTFTPDLDGTQDVSPNGSGSGSWNVHDATGVTETCTYDFDSSGTISNLVCSAASAASASPASAVESAPPILVRASRAGVALRRAHPPKIPEADGRRHSRRANSKLGS